MNHRLIQHAARGAVLVGLVTAGVAALSAPASAATVCYGYHPTDSSWSVECDGSAPTAYEAALVCNDNSVHFGPWEFEGSGIWSTTHCGTNKFPTLSTYITSD